MHPVADAAAINFRITRYLLDSITDEQWSIKADKGKSVRGQFTHIHNVRLMWIKVWGEIGDLEKLDDKTATIAEARAALDASAATSTTVIENAMESGVRLKGFKPSTEAFVSYITAHEACHRAQVDFILRLAGIAIPDDIHYGMWEWGVR